MRIQRSEIKIALLTIALLTGVFFFSPAMALVPSHFPTKIDFSVLKENSTSNQKSQVRNQIRAHSPHSLVQKRNRELALIHRDDLPKKIRVKDERGKILELTFDDYLLGVLAAEVPARWPLEALKAQAVASRSYALNRMAHQALLTQNFDIHGTIMDQVYRSPKNLHQELQERLRFAIQQTQNLVMVSTSGGILKAYFHSNCGGSRLSPEQVWGPRAEKKVSSQSCWAHPIQRWNHAISKAEFQLKLIEHLGSNLDLRFRGLNEVDLTRAYSLSDRGQKPWIKFNFFPTSFAETAFSKRLASLEVLSSRVAASLGRGVASDGLGTSINLTAQELRVLVGFNRLRSTKFIVQELEHSYFFQGVGWGHGVGMCQWGAKAMAEDGKNFREILEFFYSS